MNLSRLVPLASHWEHPRHCRRETIAALSAQPQLISPSVLSTYKVDSTPVNSTSTNVKLSLRANLVMTMGAVAIGNVPSSPLENKVFKPFFQPANCGKISAISLQSCECFCVIRIIAYKPPTTTTRQNRGNISAILLQPWECFRKSRCAYTTTQPGKIVGIFPRFRCSRGNVSVSCVVLTQPHYQANLWECFYGNHKGCTLPG